MNIRLRTFEDHQTPEVLKNVSTRLEQVIGGRCTERGFATHQGTTLFYLAFRRDEGKVRGLWLDTGASVVPLVFRIDNDGNRSTGWLEASIVPDEYRSIAEDIRMTLGHAERLVA